jgi:L,D-transpeptidase ErfK/SrfK
LTLYAIDVNIPEFKLTLFKNGVPVYSCPVRVGRNAIEYMETVKTNVDLKTPIGTGKIVRTYRSPRFTDPHTGLTYLTTVRDDGARTLMPEIPSIQPFINGVSTGKIIHATTNQITLGKAYSHGCIGLTESDMWWVYYHAPIGTPVRFRYQLQVLNENGDTIQLKDIYGLRKHAN